MTYFDHNESLGMQSEEDIAAYLRLIEDYDAAEKLTSLGASGQGLARILGYEYAQTGFIIGFIPPQNVTNDSTTILGMSEVKPDPSLKGKKIKITLDKFYIENYPGNGQHRVLCEFAGKNQAAEDVEEMRFALTVEAFDKGSASVNGKPIFMGVTVGDDGVAFEGRTVNVRSKDDDLVLNALENDSFKQGLSLIGSVQPALKPFVSLAAGVVKAASKRNWNRQVHSFALGLDFSKNSTSARLRYGSYVVVQVDTASWDWANFAWNPDSMAITAKADGSPLALNHLIVGVAPFEGPAPASNIEKKAPTRAIQGPRSSK